MGTGTCAPIEAGPRGTRVKDSCTHRRGYDGYDKSLWSPSIPPCPPRLSVNAHTIFSGSLSEQVPTSQ